MKTYNVVLATIVAFFLVQLNAQGQTYKLTDDRINVILNFCEDSMFNIIRSHKAVDEYKVNNISIGFYILKSDTLIFNDGLNHFKNVLVKKGETYRYLEGFDFLVNKEFSHISNYSSCICDKDFYLNLVEKDNHKYKERSNAAAVNRKYKNERLVGVFYSDAPSTEDIFEFLADGTFNFKFGKLNCFSGKWHTVNDFLYLKTEMFDRTLVLKVRKRSLQSVYLPDFIRSEYFLKNNKH